MKKLYLCLLASLFVCGTVVGDLVTRLLIDSASAQTLQPHAFPITASATGTTLATTATLPATAGLTNYICGFSIRANATAAITGNATVTGMVSGTMNFTQFVAPLATAIGNMDINFSVCLPANSSGVAIAVNSIAPGAGGTVSVTVWGWQIQ